MPFPPVASRMPSRALPTRRHRGAVVTAAVTALATAGCLAVVSAGPAGAASRDRSVPASSQVRPAPRALAPATTARATPATAGTTGAPTATAAVRPWPRWAASTRRHVRSVTVDPAAAEVVRLVNVARASAGCAAVRVDSRLTTAARLHSEDMARQDYFSHTSLDGRTPWDRIEAQGYTAGSAENIAAGHPTPAAVMTGWMNSAGHRANILNCSNRAIGVGLGHGGSYGIYWTQDFGRQ